jgi:sorbose reductase
MERQTAVLTGAARCLGLAFAVALAEAGANIAVLDVIQPYERLFQIRTDNKVKVEFYKTDAANREAVTKAIEAIEKDFGRVDVKCVYRIPCSDSELFGERVVYGTGSFG